MVSHGHSPICDGLAEGMLLDPKILKDETLNIMIAGRDTVRDQFLLLLVAGRMNGWPFIVFTQTASTLSSSIYLL